MKKAKAKETDLKEIPIPNMTQAELEARCRFFSRRARNLCGTTLKLDENGRPEWDERQQQYCTIPIGTAVGDFFDRMAKGLNDPETIRQRNEFMEKVEKDPEARRQFCALRLETYNNYLMAEMRWIEYFCEIVTLADDERPLVQNHYDKEIKCYYVGGDGRPKEFKVFFDDEETPLPLRVLTSPKMRYKVNDLYRGNIVKQAVKSLTLMRDMTNKMESEAKAMLLTGLGTFTFTGTKPNWPFVANSYVNTANLPQTNDVQLVHAHGGSPGDVIGSFDYPVLDEIINYAKLINAVRLPGSGDFRPTGRIRVPSTHIRNFGTFAAGSDTPGSATPAAAAPARPQEEVYEEGWGGVDYKKISWVFEPDATLDPTVNQCYPEFTIKPARIFMKPSQDREVVRTGEQDYQLFQDNSEERWMKKVYTAYMNSATRIYFARFNY